MIWLANNSVCNQLKILNRVSDSVGGLYSWSKELVLSNFKEIFVGARQGEGLLTYNLRLRRAARLTEPTDIFVINFI